MAIEFRCTECGTMLRVDEVNRGKMARCPKCSMINSIPGATVPNPLEATAKVAEPPPTTYLPREEDRWSMRGVDGTIYGPIRIDDLRRWYDEGRINYQCSVQRIGETQWQPALDVLVPNRGAAVESPFTPQVQNSASVHVGPFVPHNGTLIIILACVGIFVAPCAFIAVFMGHNELRRIRAGIVEPSGESAVRAGYALGIIFSITGILFWCCCCPFPGFWGPHFRF